MADSTFSWSKAYQVFLTILLALSPAAAIAYLDLEAPAGTVYVAHHLHELAIAMAVAISLFVAVLAYRCHKESGEPLTRWLALSFFGFALLYAPHGLLTFMAHDNPGAFLLWGPASRLAMSALVLCGLLAPQGWNDAARPDAQRSWLPALAALGLLWLSVAGIVTLRPDLFKIARLGMEIAAGALSLIGLVVLVARRATGPLLWFHAVALAWFVLASASFILAKPWNAQWWLAHAISAAGFLLLGAGIAHISRTSQAFRAFYSPETLFSLLSNAERMSTELRRAKEEAERSSLAKSTFLAAASHDLRQPAQAISLYMGVLRARIGDKHPASEVLPHVETAVEALSAILNSLLEVSRLDAGMVAVNAVDFTIGPLLAEMASTGRAQAANRKLAVECEPSSLRLHADPALLRQLLSHVMANAVKFTDQGCIHLSCRSFNGAVRIEIRDTGPGIPAAKHAAIFEDFVQLDNHERDRTKGLGLGLAIVRRLAALMAGKVGVDSRYGDGSCFWVELPAAISEVRAHQGRATLSVATQPF